MHAEFLHLAKLNIFLTQTTGNILNRSNFFILTNKSLVFNLKKCMNIGICHTVSRTKKIIPAWTSWRYIENQQELVAEKCDLHSSFVLMKGLIVYIYSGQYVHVFNEYFFQIVTATGIGCRAVWGCGCQSDSGAGWRTAGAIRWLLSHSWGVPEVHHAAQPHLRIPKVLPWPQIFPKLHLS